MGSEGNSDRRVFEKSNGVNPLYDSCWDPMLDFGNSSCMDPNYSGVLENQIMGNGSSNHLVHFPSDMLPKIPCFGNGSFSEMVSSFGHSNFQHNTENVELFRANGKRKRNVSMGALVENIEEEKQLDTCTFPKEDYEKKQNLEENVGASESEQTVKEVKDKSNSEEPSKKSYIHVRAKRGQATNSHSLAERVRREKISERMRLLQELVPGCNKITGKAVMLDEIINYVQSLQHQVEFLSMKLATVNPELNMNIERIMSKDVSQSRDSITSALPFPGYSNRTFIAGQRTPSPFHPFPHNLWNNNELQSILQMGFNSDPPARSLGTNGLSKMEL